MDYHVDLVLAFARDILKNARILSFSYNHIMTFHSFKLFSFSHLKEVNARIKNKITKQREWRDCNWIFPFVKLTEDKRFDGDKNISFYILIVIKFIA